MTHPPTPRHLTILASWFVALMACAEDGAPQPYPLGRYAGIWDSGWFAATEPSESEPAVASSEEAHVPYKVVGLADWNGRQWAYLREDAGQIVELTFGTALPWPFVDPDRSGPERLRRCFGPSAARFPGHPAALKQWRATCRGTRSQGFPGSHPRPSLCGLAKKSGEGLPRDGKPRTSRPRYRANPFLPNRPALIRIPSLNEYP